MNKAKIRYNNLYYIEKITGLMCIDAKAMNEKTLLYLLQMVYLEAKNLQGTAKNTNLAKKTQVKINNVVAANLISD